MYQDYFLRFVDEAEAQSVLFDGETAKYAATDVIGTIYEPTGDTLVGSEGPISVVAPIPGWHVNVRHSADAPELETYRVFPDTPTRNWM